MAAIESPRRILGDRDVNKPLPPKQSIAASSPGKLASYSSSTVAHEKSLSLGNLTRVLLSQKMQESASASLTSPSRGIKRGASCLEDAQNGPQQKQTVVVFPLDDSSEVQSGGIDCKSRLAQSNKTDGRVGTALGDAILDHGHLRRSVSPDSSFDATQDSEFMDSQNTTLTEPEDHAPLPFPALITSHPPQRIVSRAEARENAEALSLRLRVAMYKVKTNQTNLPLSQLQIRPSRADYPYPQQPIRTPLPTLRPAPTLKPATTTHIHPAPDRTMHCQTQNKDPKTTPSSPSLRAARMGPESSSIYNSAHNDSDSATPVLPRSRDGYVHHNRRGSPERDSKADGEVNLTTSIVKGRAADGLLSLMGSSGPTHLT